MRQPSSPAGRKPTGPGRADPRPGPARSGTAGTTGRSDTAGTTGRSGRSKGGADRAESRNARTASRSESGTGARAEPGGSRRPSRMRPGRPDAVEAGTQAAPGRRPRSDEQSDGAVSVVGRIAERDAERRAADRRRLLGRAAWAVAGAALAAGLGWVFFFSPLFALDPEQVTVTGQGTTIDTAEVRALIGEARDVPLPRLDTVSLRARVLTLSGVKDARIAHAWPHGLTVELTSREPVVAVPAGGRYALLDADAVRVGTTSSPRGVPVIDAPLSDDDAARAALFAALDVVAALPRGLADKVTAVRADTQDDVRTRLADGAEILWGNGDRLELKIAVATTLRKAEPNARTYDVSSPDLPVTR